ncbi:MULTISPECIES: arsenate reductase ArsC [Pseudomonas]|uniref:Protein tyrosine phosphatase n=1 Tax=Pseudomonas fulva TaxID=47880 RepID=A0A0D0KGB1_9PSED|nr:MULTISPECIES: arsenate reductase ArsC [Pseudomonas]KIP97059.1 protein tyrosine phosphatase [Pseudomonas fulva]
MSEKLRVLFVCVANDARSPMAEALLRHLDSEHFEAHSAGTQPGQLDPRVITTLAHAGVSPEGLRSKSMDEFAGQHFDYLIDLCDKSSDEPLLLPSSREALVWNFADPTADEHDDAFRHTFQEISERVRMFTLVKNKVVNV